MSDIFQQIPATLYLASLTALATLAGVLLTNGGTYSRLKLRLEYEKKEKQRELLFSKLEELYLLFTQWSYGTLKLNSSTRSWIEGRLSTEEFTKEVESEPRVDYHSVDMLVNIYFPSLRADYEKLVALSKESFHLVLVCQTILDLEEEHSAERARILKILETLHADYAEQSEVLKKSIAEQTTSISIGMR